MVLRSNSSAQLDEFPLHSRPSSLTVLRFLYHLQLYTPVQMQNDHPLVCNREMEVWGVNEKSRQGRSESM